MSVTDITANLNEKINSEGLVALFFNQILDTLYFS